MKRRRITQEQADAIGRILDEEYETNPAFREVIDAKTERSTFEEANTLVPFEPHGHTGCRAAAPATPPAGAALSTREGAA